MSGLSERLLRSVEDETADGADDFDAIDNGERADIRALLGPAYARDLIFWRHTILTFVFGLLLGVITFGYLTSLEDIQEKWWGKGYGKSIDSVGFFKGKLYWVVITSATGVLVGITKILINFPRKLDGFFKEVKQENVHKGYGLKVFLVSYISLAGGVSLGPEAAMASLGGGMNQRWSEIMKLSEEMSRRQVINGFTSSIGALFPNPIIAVMCMLEVANMETMHSEYMRTLVQATVGACSSFATFFWLKDESYFPFNPLVLTYNFKGVDMIKAIVIGIACGFLGVVHVLITGIVKKVFTLVGTRIRNERMRLVILPTILNLLIYNASVGGVIIGLIAILSPLTLGSGSQQTQPMISGVERGEFGYDILFVAALMKSFSSAISIHSGFVGGTIFPLVFIGVALGLGFYRLIDDPEILPLLLSVGCFMAGIPACVCPIPFTIVLMITFSFQLGAYQATPIFVTAITSHLTTCGCGILLKLLRLE